MNRRLWFPWYTVMLPTICVMRSAIFPYSAAEQQTKDVMKGLKSAAGWLRREVGHKVQLRYAPELVFELDQSITHGAHISEVLHELKNEGKLGEEDAE